MQIDILINKFKEITHKFIIVTHVLSLMLSKFTWRQVRVFKQLTRSLDYLCHEAKWKIPIYDVP